MLCSNCGKELGAIAHIYNDQLLCENCFLKIKGTSETTSPSTTVFVGNHDDQERADASQSIPAESNPEQPSSSPAQAEQKVPPHHPSLFYPGEQVFWKRTFSKGIIHREATFTEAITNLRAFVIDDAINSIVRACPLRGSEVVVTNTRRDSTQVRTGFGYSGHYASTGVSTGRTLGDVQFMLNGNLVLTLHNVADPYGLKKLIEGSVKSSR